MNIINETAQNYVDLVQKATRRNTLTQITEARQAGAPVDAKQIRLSNQQLRVQARETGVQLYSNNIQQQAVETYVNSSPNNTANSNNSDSKPTNNVDTFNPESVNDMLKTVQNLALGVALYENLNRQINSANIDLPSVNVFT